MPPSNDRDEVLAVRTVTSGHGRTSAAPYLRTKHPEFVQHKLADTNRVTTPRWANDAGPMRSTKVEDPHPVLRSRGTAIPAPRPRCSWMFHCPEDPEDPEALEGSKGTCWAPCHPNIPHP